MLSPGREVILEKSPTQEEESKAENVEANPTAPASESEPPLRLGLAGRKNTDTPQEGSVELDEYEIIMGDEGEGHKTDEINLEEEEGTEESRKSSILSGSRVAPKRMSSESAVLDEADQFLGGEEEGRMSSRTGAQRSARGSILLTNPSGEYFDRMHSKFKVTKLGTRNETLRSPKGAEDEISEEEYEPEEEEEEEEEEDENGELDVDDTVRKYTKKQLMERL